MVNNQVSNQFSGKTFWEKVVLRKFSAPVVILFTVFFSLFVTYVIAKEGYIAGAIIVTILISLPIIYATVTYPEFGIIALLIVAFLINFSSRFLPEPTPIGLVMDLFTYLLIIGFFVRMKKERDWTRFKNPITYFTAIWIAYNLIEVINPSSPSILEWVFTVRTVGVIMLMYFVFMMHIRTKNFIKTILKVWLLLELLSGLSGFQQEHIGLFPFENDWLYRYDERYKLLFIAGHLRKWGLFSDPVVYAYNMVAAALICIAFIISDIAKNKKIILVILTIFFFMVMLYSGTRASYVIIPAALVMLAILYFNRKVFIFCSIGGLILGALIMVPTSNSTLARFQSAFRPSKDASFEERAKNQERIKPYILSHPIGGGLGSVGIWGQRFAPNSYLAKFPPDSGYVRVAVEMGYIGLLLFCVFNFIILYKGISYFYLIKDPELKTYLPGNDINYFCV